MSLWVRPMSMTPASSSLEEAWLLACVLISLRSCSVVLVCKATLGAGFDFKSVGLRATRCGKQNPRRGTADRGNMCMKNGGRFYARWLLKDHASRRRRVGAPIVQPI